MADAFEILEHEASDGYRWKYRRYPRESLRPSRGLVVFVHGIQSHSGWYEYSCTQLAKAGYTVYFLDRRGSGMNAEARGDTPSFHRLVDDIAEFIAMAPKGGPVFLAGISWGGKTSVAMAQKYPELINGLILLCPGLFPKVNLPLWQRLRIFFTRLIWPTSSFPIPLNDPELFTATPHWQEFLRNDPLRLHAATARMMVQSARLDMHLRWSSDSVKCPVLLMLAGEDRIIRNDLTRDYINAFASTDKTIIEYPGAHHTLEFEPDADRFIGDIQSWLDRHSQII